MGRELLLRQGSPVAVVGDRVRPARMDKRGADPTQKVLRPSVRPLYTPRAGIHWEERSIQHKIIFATMAFLYAVQIILYQVDFTIG
jgi:hypothetical protein